MEGQRAAYTQGIILEGQRDCLQTMSITLEDKRVVFKQSLSNWKVRVRGAVYASYWKLRGNVKHTRFILFLTIHMF